MQMSVKTNLYFDIGTDQCPIIYSKQYNIGFFGIQKLHPFDVTKWGRAYKKLLEKGILKVGQSVEPREAQSDDLLKIHTKEYLNSLKFSITVARISEVCPLVVIPACLLNTKLLRPLRYQTGGSILGTKLAKERGWAINLGGGFHHCSSKRGGGFCFYADISLCIKFLLDSPEFSISKIMVVDLDAHQGNGHERDWGSDKQIFILDAFNQGIYPHDTFARSRIQCPILLKSFTTDEPFLHLIQTNLSVSLDSFDPDFVIYNAGTDILENDPLGYLSISKEGIIKRDELVFTDCIKRKIPILMLTSGGYQRETADVIADSIENLVHKNIIHI